MSTVAQAKPNNQPGYTVARPGGKCAITGNDISPADKFMALLKETPTGLERLDISMPAWVDVNKDDALAYWQAVMPTPEQAKRKLFVDDEILGTLFEKLSNTDEPTKLSFRFVLGLILIRKRILTYENTETINGQNIWTVRFRGKDQRMTMIDPRLNAEQIQAVSGQLSEIMNEEL